VACTQSSNDDGKPKRGVEGIFWADTGRKLSALYLYIYNVGYCAQQQIQQKRVEVINMYEVCVCAPKNAISLGSEKKGAWGGGAFI